ncbi:hypothetical protein D3C86_1363090 [compost metagenome]
MPARFPQKEESGLRVDRGHLIVLGLVDFGEWLFEYLADGIDRNIGPAHGGDGIGEQFLDGGRRRQVALQGNGLGARGLDGRDGRVGIGLGCGAVVVDRNRARALGGQIASNQAAQILGPACDERNLALDGMVCHGKSPARVDGA